MSVHDALVETGHSNAERAGWADHAIEKAYRQKGLCGDDYETAITDILADLFHLAARQGLEPEKLRDRAWDHYLYESDLEAA